MIFGQKDAGAPTSRVVAKSRATKSLGRLQKTAVELGSRNEAGC